MYIVHLRPSFSHYYILQMLYVRAQSALAGRASSSPTPAPSNLMAEAVVDGENAVDGDDNDINVVSASTEGDAGDIPARDIYFSAEGAAASGSLQHSVLPEASPTTTAKAETPVPTPTVDPTTTEAAEARSTPSSTAPAGEVVEAVGGQEPGSRAGAAVVLALKRLEDLGLEVGAQEHTAALYACAEAGCGRSAMAVLR